MLQLNKASETLRYDPATDSFAPTSDDPTLLPLGIAYFQTAAELFKTRRYR